MLGACALGPRLEIGLREEGAERRGLEELAVWWGSGRLELARAAHELGLRRTGEKEQRDVGSRRELGLPWPDEKEQRETGAMGVERRELVGSGQRAGGSG